MHGHRVLLTQGPLFRCEAAGGAYPGSAMLRSLCLCVLVGGCQPVPDEPAVAKPVPKAAQSDRPTDIAAPDKPTRARVPLQIDVVGEQWKWTASYPEVGTRLSTRNDGTDVVLVVPQGADVALRLTSSDVIHRLDIPALSIKAEAVPGRVHTVKFNAPETGRYPVLCGEYCGEQHASMAGLLQVVSPNAYDAALRHAAAREALPSGQRRP